MNVEIVVSDRFQKDVKHLVKKYPSLKQDLLALQALLQADPITGIPLGHDCYKIKYLI